MKNREPEHIRTQNQDSAPRVNNSKSQPPLIGKRNKRNYKQLLKEGHPKSDEMNQDDEGNVSDDDNCSLSGDGQKEPNGDKR